MSELYMYYMVLYWKFFNTYCTNVTYDMRDPHSGSVSYRLKSDSDPALDPTVRKPIQNEIHTTL